MDYAMMAQAAAQRRWERLHEDRPFHDGTFTRWSAKPDAAHPFHRDDGTRIWVSAEDLSPDDDFLGDGSGVPASRRIPASGGVGQPPPNTGPDDQ